MNAILIKYNQHSANHSINASGFAYARPAPVSNSRVMAARAILDQIKRMH